MINLFKIDGLMVRRIVSTMLVALLVVAGLPAFQPKSQAAQFASRSIQMSDSANSGGSVTSGVGSGTNVTYRLTFTTGPQTAGSMVIDFCTENPIVGDTCTRPAGMDTSPTPTIGDVTGQVTNAGWTVASTTDGQIELRRATGTDMAASTLQRFDLIGIVNPSTIGTFYARMYSYQNNNLGTYSGPTGTNPGNFVDYGGIALTTTNFIRITARVQEQLTFCVTAAAHSAWLAASGGTADECSASEVGANPPAVTLGHGSPTPTLDANTVDTSTIYSQLSTNATSGAVVNLRSSNNANGCTGANGGGLSADGGQTCAIPPVNAGSGTGATALTAGTAGFGLFVTTSALGPNGVGSLTPSSAYHTNGHRQADPAFPGDPDTYYGMDSTTVAANGTGPSSNVGNVTTTFGSIIASTTSPAYRVNTRYVFAATAALTTPAGIYTANLSMIATGTF